MTELISVLDRALLISRSESVPLTAKELPTLMSWIVVRTGPSVRVRPGAFSFAANLIVVRWSTVQSSSPFVFSPTRMMTMEKIIPLMGVACAIGIKQK